MEKSYQNTTFSDLQELEKLPEEESNPSFFSRLFGLITQLFCLTNETVYKVQDDSYGIDITKWEGCFYNEKGKKEMQSLQIGNNIYTGESQDGKPHGKGTMNYQSGNVYKGEWVNGKLNGKREMIYADDASYIQEPIEDEREDYVTCNSKNGDVYEGKLEQAQSKSKEIPENQMQLEQNPSNNCFMSFKDYLTSSCEGTTISL